MADAGDAGIDAASPPSTTCRALHEQQPLLPDGVYPIDLDGPGPIPTLGLYCDMSFNQGGWTLVQSYTGKNAPQQMLDADGDGIDGGIGFLVAPPSPGSFGALTGEVTAALAALSTQVRSVEVTQLVEAYDAFLQILG